MVIYGENNFMKKNVTPNTISYNLFEKIKDVKYQILDSDNNLKLILKSQLGEFEIEDFEILKTILKYLDKKSFTFITAYNPKGINKENDLNIKSNQSLELDLSGYVYLETQTIFQGINDELGYLVFDLPLDKAIIYMNKYNQNAIVIGNTKEIKLLFND